MNVGGKEAPEAALSEEELTCEDLAWPRTGEAVVDWGSAAPGSHWRLREP